MLDPIPPELFAPAARLRATTLAGTRPQSFWSDVWRRFRRTPPPWRASPFSPSSPPLADRRAARPRPTTSPPVDLFATYQRPSWSHWFGTDALGRDIWLQVWVGARVSLTVGLVAALAQMLIGVVIGCFSGLYGGRVDMVIMRFVDIMIAIPFLIWVCLLVLVLEPGMLSIIVAFALTQWTEIARLVRGEVLRLKETEFVIAARALGAGPGRLIARTSSPISCPWSSSR